MRMFRFLLIASVVVVAIFFFLRMFLAKVPFKRQIPVSQNPTPAQIEAQQKLEQQLHKK